MDITFRTVGPWGPGKGANLQASEVDNNFWEIAEHILTLENDPPLPNGIASITVSGTQMTITLTDGTVMGPYTLPVLVMHWRGEMQPGTYYFVLDVFTVENTGIFLVQVEHELVAFDPDLVIDGVPVYLQLFGSADASLSALPDVSITAIQDNDFLSWQASAGVWVNRQLGTMAFQPAYNVAILGGTITGLPTPTQPSDAATKGYVDSLPEGATAPAGTMMSNITNIVAPAIPNTFSDYLDHVLGTSIRGTLLYRGATGWIALPPGSPSYFLQTGGPGFDPTWAIGTVEAVTSIIGGAGIQTTPAAITTTGSVALAPIADNRLLANISGTTVAPSATTLSAILDKVMSSTRGSVLVRAGGGWVALAPGTAGYFLQTQGATADPLWASPAGAGTVTSVSAGTGITTGGAPITGAGTVSLAAIANLSVLANISGGSAAPVPLTATLLFDALFGATQGAVLYRSASAWSMLAPGTSGQVLTTGGGLANPTWANAAAGAPIANLQLLANISGATAAASGNTLSNILDAVISSSRGTLLYRGATGWVGLAPGTSGQLLQTGGAAGDPSWVTGATGGGGASITTSDSPPATPNDGDAWWDSSVGGGQLYISYTDANSQQWVPASNQPGPMGATGATGATGPAGSANMTGMTAGQIPIAATATSVTSSANLSGDVTSNSALAVTLATVNSNVGTFQGLTLDAKGRVTAASNQSYATSAAMTTADNLRVLKAGDTMSGDLAVTGGINANGAAGAISISDRTTPAHYWVQSSTADVLHIDNDAGARVSINRAGDMAVAGMFTPGSTINSTYVIPVADNTYLCGNVGKAWVNVISYAYTTSSDASLKSNIEPAPSALADVLALDPKTFTWASGPDTARVHWGFLAQDVAAVMGEDFGGYIDGGEGEKGIIYHELVAVLWQAVRELKAEVDALKAGAAA